MASFRIRFRRKSLTGLTWGSPFSTKLAMRVRADYDRLQNTYYDPPRYCSLQLELLYHFLEHPTLLPVFKLNLERGGPSEELQQLMPDMFGKVIPRLLRPLES